MSAEYFSDNASSPEPGRFKRAAIWAGRLLLNALAAAGGCHPYHMTQGYDMHRFVPDAEPESDSASVQPIVMPISVAMDQPLTAEQERQVVAQGVAFADDTVVARAMSRMTSDHYRTWPQPWRER